MTSPINASPAADPTRSSRPVAVADGAVRTVRPGAKALVWAGDCVLLVRERREDGSTFWTLPGGGVEPGESLCDCLQRELLEELDCRVRVKAPVATCLYEHTTLPDAVTLYAVLEAETVTRPEPNPSEGVVGHSWEHPADLPAGTLDPFVRLLTALSSDR